jgi:hypothetical protein
MFKDAKQVFTAISLSAGLLALNSCGGSGGDGGGGSKSPAPQQRESTDIESDLIGQYKAKLRPINESVAGMIAGSVTLSREEDQLVGYVRFAGVKPKVLHTQYVHVSKKCPETDENGDGFIDAVEADKDVGKVLIPLDADLSTQDRGSSIWPVSDDYGSYIYSQIASYDKMMNDLRDGDLDPEDDFIKLGENKTLEMSGRVIVIYGVAADTVLPSTVARRGRLANYQNLPIACGVFEKVRTVPGEADNDRDVGEAPAGSTSGGSSGSDDGSTVIIGETSGGAGGETGGGTGWTQGGSTGEDTTSTAEDDDDWRWPWESIH